MGFNYTPKIEVNREYLFHGMKVYEIVNKGGVKPFERLKRIVYRLIGNEIIERNQAISIINKVSKKVSCNPSQTANALIGTFGDWVRDGFNCKPHIFALSETCGKYSNLYPFEPIYMCPDCKCLHEDDLLVSVPTTYSQDETRLAIIKKDYITGTHLCCDCRDKIELSFNKLIEVQKTINKGKKEVNNEKDKH